MGVTASWRSRGWSVLRRLPIPFSSQQAPAAADRSQASPCLLGSLGNWKRPDHGGFRIRPRRSINDND